MLCAGASVWVAKKNYLTSTDPDGLSASAVRASRPPRRPPRGGDGLYLRPATAVATHRHPVSELHALLFTDALGCRYPQPRGLSPCPRTFVGVPGAPFGAPAVHAGLSGVPGTLTVSPRLRDPRN